jgi:hypothetical protein
MHMSRAKKRSRAGSVLAASTAAIASLALIPAGAPAADTITAGAGGTSVVVNGTTISTSNLTLAELGKLQGVPASTVNLELEGVAAGTPVASAVDAIVSSLPAETTLASALNTLSAASGGAISPETALQRVVAFNGRPGAAGAGGGAGGNGSGGGSGTNGSAGSGAGTTGAPNGTPANKAFILRTASKTLKGRPGSRVRVRFNVSSAAKLSYAGRKLHGGSKAIRSGSNVLIVTLPRKQGTYRLTLKAVNASEGQSAQAVVMLKDAKAKRAKTHH